MSLDVESEHVALFWHGKLAHSSTSTSQFPPQTVLLSLSKTVHSVVYSAMKPYTHQPFAKPATHVQRYVWTDIDASVLESEQVPPFAQGELAHSSTSMSQFPFKTALSLLSVTVHSVSYSTMFAYPHSPLANPGGHVHR